jgi:hypothetical protein
VHIFKPTIVSKAKPPGHWKKERLDSTINAHLSTPLIEVLLLDELAICGPPRQTVIDDVTCP